MQDQDRTNALAEEILADAQQQADGKRQRAHRSAQRILRSETARAQQLEKDALADAEQQLEHQVRTLMADLPHQNQMRSVQVKDQIISDLFQQVLHTLRTREGIDLLPILVRLSSDAIALLDGNHFVLELDPQDVDTLGDRLGDQTVADVRTRYDRDVIVDIVASNALPDGGVIVRPAAENAVSQMIDNSFATRLRRAEPQLRGQIADRLFGDAAP